ncbi:DUF1338 family protein [Litchfieldella xinjiangensis]|uniref:DUF1338 family protein n=1 Tax=Litchfieldella xinjiangensis TaxID=1166948 RepID=UPI0005BDF14B|nr:DUF1338 family protein [Halomonas xinjiangensis]
MQRQAFLQELWLDYVHHHPELGALRLWPLDSCPEYLTLLTLNHGPYAANALLPALKCQGYAHAEHFAMADRGLLVTLLSPPDEGAWLILAELQLGTLTREPRAYLQSLIQRPRVTSLEGLKILTRGRPWEMPDWSGYERLHQAHPLAAWLAVMGPRIHHVGFDCECLGNDLVSLDQQMQRAGFQGTANRLEGVFPVSPLLNFRFYATRSQRMAFAGGDEHRIAMGGLALVQKCLPSNRERAAELLMPRHTRCEIG